MIYVEAKSTLMSTFFLDVLQPSVWFVTSQVQQLNTFSCLIQLDLDGYCKNECARLLELCCCQNVDELYTAKDYCSVNSYRIDLEFLCVFSRKI